MPMRIWPGLPQETILFDRARVHRRFDIALDEAASLLYGGIVVFGRTAMGERMEQGEFIDRWAAAPWRQAPYSPNRPARRQYRCKAGATGGGQRRSDRHGLHRPRRRVPIERIREASDAFSGEVGISAWNGFAMARFCAQAAARLRADMMAVLARTGVALPRLWLN